MAQKLSKNQEIIFPDESHFVIQEILKKYKLHREPKEIMEKLAQELKEAQTFKEKEKITGKQPERKIARLIKDMAEEKIMIKDFPEELRQIFNISPKIAKDLAKDLEKNVLAFARKVVIEREITPLTRKRVPIKPLPVAPPPPEESLKTPAPSEPETVPPKIEKPETPLEEEKPMPRKEDTYREPFE